ncbi:MAG: MBL fold metallo-hydrolase [Alphaproteobacteria bacterium]|nr:MBL fold metallo-hydrolase [Alphaproteobacteria bacterium]
MSRTLIALAALSLTACAPAEPLKVHAFVSGAEGFDTSTYWVDTGAEVVVFDAQFTPALAEAMLAEIEAATDSPVRYVVVTHPNPDKFNGATVFQTAGAKLVASEATAQAMPGVHAYKEAYFVGAGMFEAGSYPLLPEVDLTFSGELSLDLDGEADVTLVELENPGVSSTQTVAVLDDALIVGDLAVGGVHAWFEGGIVDGAPAPTVDGWIAALDELSGLADASATVYPGRGAPTPVGELVPAQQAYLEGMQALVHDYVAGLEDPAAALGGEEAWGHYEAITAEAEAAYPALGLSYLVTYGVYGLAMEEAGML